jgi:DNA-binding CsgD family transcriptional regulator
MSTDLDHVEAARRVLVRSATDPGRPGDPSRIQLLVDVAEQMIDAGESNLALSLLSAAAVQSWWADPGKEARGRVVSVAQKLPVTPDDPRLLSILTFADPGEHGGAVIEAMSAVSPDDYDAETARLIGVAVNVTGAKDLSYGFLSKAVGALREQGRLGLLPQVLAEQAWTAINMLDWRVAVPAAEEATRLAAETGQPLWEAAGLTSQAMLAGLRGDEEAAEAMIAAAEQIVVPLGASVVIAGVQLTRGQIALSSGRHQEAYEHLRRMFDPADPAYHYFIRSWAVGDFAEAALHSGHREEAIEEMTKLEPLAEIMPSAWFRNGLFYARPLLADAESAEKLFEEALLADMSRWPLFRGRLLLEYGTWLRRRRRVSESRAPLRSARDAFDALGLVAWGERARRELRASGETSRQRVPEAWSRLTPQEMQIAQMAADGLTNREIGQHLYLSHRTVGSHLYRVFPKLGITSRNQLSAALMDVPSG